MEKFYARFFADSIFHERARRGERREKRERERRERLGERKRERKGERETEEMRSRIGALRDDSPTRHPNNAPG